MTVVSRTVENLTFDFPAGWAAEKYDDLTFYRNQFSRQMNGIKAVDLIAIDLSAVCYLIEVKDYRHPDTEKPSQLAEAVAGKVFSTLAALLPMKLLASVAGDKALATKALQAIALRVFLHVELPQSHKPVVDPADLQQKLRKLVRSVDPHMKVVRKSPGASLWTVTS